MGRERMETECKSRVVVLFTALPLWSLGGSKGGPALYYTVSSLVSRGYRVHMLSPHPHSGEAMPGVEHHLVAMPPSRLATFRAPGLGLLYRLAWTELFRRRAVGTAHRECPLQEAALVYGYEVHGVPPARDLATRLGLPLVTRFQGTILSTWIGRRAWQWRYYEHVRALRCPAEAVIMTNDGTQGDQVLQRLGAWGSHVKFWMNGVDKLQVANPEAAAALGSSLGIAADDYVLLTVSRLERWKRVDRAITALAGVLPQIPNCHLVVVGDGGERAGLETLASSLGVSDRVHFAGAVARDRLAEYYALADVFLSLYDLSNVGNPLLEAMQCERCLVTLDVGDTRTVVTHGETGLVLSLEQLPALPEIIVGLLQDPVTRQRLGRAAKQYADTHFWSWPERMRAEGELLDQLTAQGRKATARC